MSHLTPLDGPKQPAAESPVISRRGLLVGGAAAVGATLLGTLPSILPAQGSSTPTSGASEAPSRPIGEPTSAISSRSPFEQPARTPTGQVTGASFSPLQEFSGTITPTDLHFERHHSGVPIINPAQYALLVHGLVDRPTVFTLADLKRLPSATRTHFLECSGNGRTAYRSPKRELTPQLVDGLTSNAEWTGVPLTVLLTEVGVKPAATWLLAEGGDAGLLSRSVPLEKAMDDALLVYAQNGEPLRPAAGYPVRLLLPGWEGNVNVKWLRRLKLTADPAMTKDETSKYTILLKDEKAWQFVFPMEVKSVITRPSPGLTLRGPGFYEISGQAWSGNGSIRQVDVSADGGRSWAPAALQGPILPKAPVRFRAAWQWNGGPAVLQSRATDDTGMVQPTRAQFGDERGLRGVYHYNAIASWRIDEKGEASNVYG